MQSSRRRVANLLGLFDPSDGGINFFYKCRFDHLCNSRQGANISGDLSSTKNYLNVMQFSNMYPLPTRKKVRLVGNLFQSLGFKSELNVISNSEIIRVYRETFILCLHILPWNGYLWKMTNERPT